MTQTRYASLLATKWLIERLGNRSSAGRQQTGRPSRRRRKRGRVIPVPASDHRKKGRCRLLTVQCKYLVCFLCILLLHSVLPAFCSSECVRVDKARTRICATLSQICFKRSSCSVSYADGGQRWRVFTKLDWFTSFGENAKGVFGQKSTSQRRRVFDPLTESIRARAKGNKAGGVKEGV